VRRTYPEDSQCPARSIAGEIVLVFEQGYEASYEVGGQVG